MSRVNTTVDPTRLLWNTVTSDYPITTGHNNYSNEDLDIGSCERILSQAKVNQMFTLLLHYTLIPTIILVIIFAFLVRRKYSKLSWCNARPGIPIPLNLIEEQNDRFSYLAAIALTTWVVLDAIFGDTQFAWTDANPIFSLYLKFLSFLLIGLIYWPIFAALSSRHVIGYAFGSLYIWWITAISLLNSLPCKTYPDMRDGFMYFFTNVPLFAFSLFLCVSMPIRGLQALLNKTHCNFEIFKYGRSLTFFEEHVNHLMKSNRKRGNMQERKLMNLLDQFYRPLPGFKYSLGMLAGIWIGILFVYLVCIMIFQSWWKLAQWSLSLVTPYFEITQNAENMANLARRFGMDSNSTEFLKLVIVEAHFWLTALSAMLYISIISAFILTTTSLLLSLRNYRKHLLNLYKGKYKHILDCSKWSGREILVPAVKFTGFQLGYAVWGFLIQLFAICLLLLMTSILIILIVRYGWIGLFYSLLKRFLPALVYIILLMILQNFISYFFFCLETSEGSRVRLALNNRRAFFNYHYFMLFINAPLGLLSCLMRIIKAIIFGLWVLPRLDVSTLNRHTERFDAGYISYVAMIVLENALTNPVMLVFLKQLAETAKNRRKSVTRCTEMEKKLKRFLLVRNRWQVLLTLNNNPNLIVRRKAKTKNENENENENEPKSLSPSILKPLDTNFSLCKTKLNITNCEVIKKGIDNKNYAYIEDDTGITTL